MKQLTNVMEKPDPNSSKSSTSRQSKYLKIYAMNKRKKICELAQSINFNSAKRIKKTSLTIEC
jgi:hypothetical protein